MCALTYTRTRARGRTHSQKLRSQEIKSSEVIAEFAVTWGHTYFLFSRNNMPIDDSGYYLRTSLRASGKCLVLC